MARRDFHLVDLRSQERAVNRFLAGRTTDEKLAWLASRGVVTTVPVRHSSREVYHFESRVGLWCAFSFDGDTLSVK